MSMASHGRSQSCLPLRTTRRGRSGGIFMPAAHPDPLSQVPLFTSAWPNSLLFLDDKSNEISIWPRKKTAKAYFETSVATIPADFNKYTIHF